MLAIAWLTRDASTISEASAPQGLLLMLGWNLRQQNIEHTDQCTACLGYLGHIR